MQMRAVSVHLPKQMISRLRTLAHLESLHSGRELTGSEIIRRLIEKHLV
jgi:predicted DNA-binding protein